MIWLHYRLSRLQLLIGLGALAVVALALALTGPDLADLSSSENFLQQAARHTPNSFLYVATILLTYAVPALLGAFWGAALVAREVEAGTHRLIWAQGVGRTRWLAYRLGLGAAAVLVISGLLTLAITWWAAPIDAAVPKEGPTDVFSFNRMSPFLFGVRGLVPIGYALFAFTLGVVLGMVLRRTLVALGLTMALMVVLQVCMPLFVRAHLAAPIDTRLAITLDNLRGLEGTGSPQNPQHKTFHISGAGAADWVLSDETVDRSGTAPAQLPDYVPDCMPEPGQDDSASAPGGERDRCIQQLAADGYQQHIVYHPESAFWTLQWRETGLLVGGAALLTGFAFWRIRRDL
ncbi:transporter [Kineosporia sp. NBRC 101677]|uniref:ABC transporter permease subunit n=1 Tax=Kineosporia sp. NBRC 101677 TaxID=3032197 RepID=UPI0024A1A2AB|nr:ABC transporter permease subunit [Kineosporia sp. NBRC 101677]GLY18117.1 transporter [Kineosporia sp. NBRC 101677]